MPTYLGLDLGTTAAKGVILSDSGQVLARARVPHPGSRTAVAGRADPGAWEQSIAEVCRRLGSELGGITAIGIDTHCPSIVPLGADRRSVGGAVTWHHPALAHWFARLNPGRSAAWVAATGNHPAPSTTMALAYHVLRETDPDAFTRLVTMGFVGTWLGSLLTGVCAADRTQLSYSGAYDVTGTNEGWLPDALEELGVDDSVLPPVRDPLCVLGAADTDYAKAVGLPPLALVIVGCADTPAAAHALGYSSMMSLGTTHVVSGTRATPDTRGLVLQRRGVRQGQWLVNGAANGGDALLAGARLFGRDTGPSGVSDLIQRAARLSPAELAGTPIFISHPSAERGPLWLDQPVSALSGVTATTGGGQLARAIVDGVMFADRLVLEATLPLDDEPIQLTGAFGDDLVLPQLLADATGRSFAALTEPDLPAIGVAAMAAEATGNRVDVTPLSRPVEPRAENSAGVEARWERYVSAWSLATGKEPPAPLSASR